VAIAKQLRPRVTCLACAVVNAAFVVDASATWVRLKRVPVGRYERRSTVFWDRTASWVRQS